jgi:hypothetical protein
MGMDNMAAGNMYTLQMQYSQAANMTPQLGTGGFQQQQQQQYLVQQYQTDMYGGQVAAPQNM